MAVRGSGNPVIETGIGADPAGKSSFCHQSVRPITTPLPWSSSSSSSSFTRFAISDTLDEIVAMAVEAGITFFDSAEGYGGGTSEERLAAAVGRCREAGSIPEAWDGVLASKFIPTAWRWTKGT